MIQLEWYDAEHPASLEDFEAADALLRLSLPDEEQRSHAGQEAVQESPFYRLGLLRQDGAIRAVLGVWDLGAFVFGEHLAVSPTLRNSGLGGQIMQGLLEGLDRPFVFEVEPPELNEMAARRIGFYRRYGAHLNPYRYFQLPLQAGHEPMELKMMSWPRPLSPEEFVAYRAELYHRVYHIPR